MADENVLKEFEPGETVRANDTNANNHYLENRIKNAILSLTSKIEGNASSLNSQIETLKESLEESIKTVSDSKIEATINGNSIKFSNGILINWGAVTGMGNGTNKNLTWSTPFVGDYVTGGSATYQQWAGDKGSSWAITNQQLSYISIRSGFEQSGGHTIWVIAIGRWK